MRCRSKPKRSQRWFNGASSDGASQAAVKNAADAPARIGHHQEPVQAFTTLMTRRTAPITKPKLRSEPGLSFSSRAKSSCDDAIRNFHPREQGASVAASPLRARHLAWEAFEQKLATGNALWVFLGICP